MPSRRRTRTRRTTRQVASDHRATEIAAQLGRALHNARTTRRLSQLSVAEAAGVSQSTVSELERGRGAGMTLLVWSRATRAAGTDLRAYLEQATAADQPRDAVHLRNQELIIHSAQPGGWAAHPEAAIGRAPGRSRSVDILLTRPRELAVMEVHDWPDDIGAAARDWDRRLADAEAWAISRLPPGDLDVPRVSGCWVLRATRRNRELVRTHPGFFAARFPGSGRAWLAALSSAEHPMPAAPGILWASVDGTRLYAARLPSATLGGRP